MARIARVVVEGKPHHIIQRGNRCQNVFFSSDDKSEYLRILKEQSEKYGVEYWAYCLMDNHVHLVAVPRDRESLAKAIGETHRRYTRMINFRYGWRGYLWQGRFSSFVMSEKYLYYGIRYVERNPVRARIVKDPEDYAWSSAKAHVKRKSDALLSRCYLEESITDWRKYLIGEEDEERLKKIREHIATGRPLGDNAFIEKLELLLGRTFKKQKPGPKVNN